MLRLSALRILAASFLLLACAPAFAANRQFNTFTPASPQAPAVNPSVQLLESCPTCEPPHRSQSVVDAACADCPLKENVPPPLQPDCIDCGSGEDAMFSTAPFSTVTDTCPDCDPAELHPSVGWRTDTERTGTGIDLANGDLFHRQVDFDIPGRGFSFRFVRRHVSGISYDGPLGYGWDFNYNMRIVVDGGSDAWLYDGTGRADEFDESSGSYATPDGRFESLTKEGAPSKFKLKKPNGTVYLFDASGTNCKLESITDRAGNAMTFSYDGDSRLSTVTDTIGRTITLAYDSNGRITSVTDFDSRVWTYAYTSGELTSVTSPGVTGFTSGKVTTYAYTSNKLDQITDPKSQLILDATWTSGKVTALRYGGSGETFAISYDSSTQTTVTDRNGNDRVVTISASGHPTRIVEKTNRGVRTGEGDYTTDYTFNSDGLLTRIDFPAGNAIAYTYDTTPARERSNMLTEILYDDSDSSSRTNTWTYDSTVNLVKTHKNTMQGAWPTPTTRHTTTYFYDHEEASLGDKNGDSVTTSNDGTVVRIEHPATTTQTTDVSPVETFQYNASGQPTRWDRPGGEVRTYSYHASGAQTGYLQTQTDDPGSSPHLDIATSWTYDNVGNIATVTNDLGYVTTFTVNDLNQVTNIETPISSSVSYDTKFEYDANDNVTKKEIENLDGDGASVTANPWITTTYTYGDVLNRRTAVTDEIDASATVQTTFTYDVSRNLTQITKPEGNVEAFSYDERNLLYQRTRGTSEPVKSIGTWTYDGNRNVSTYVTGDGNTWTTTYDDWDGRASVTDPAGTLTQYENDAAGRETSREHYGGVDNATLYEETTTAYCELGKPSQTRRIYKKTPTDSGTNVDTNFEYDAASRPWKTYEVRATSPSLVQLITTRTYDSVGRPATVVNDSGDTTTYTYDGAGNVTRVAQLDKAQVGSGSDVTYTTDSTYDRRRQKLSEIRDPGSSPHLAITTTWKRDSRGNIVDQTDPRGNKQNFTYDGRGLRLTVTEDLISSTRTTSTSTYDDNGNLLQVLDDNGNQTDYAYDPLDRRTTRTNDDTTTFTWTYDDDDVVTGWTDENGTVVANTLDAMGRVTHRDMTLGSGVEGTDDEDFEYDALGRMTAADNDFSAVDLKWDSLSRCYEESTTWTANSVTRTVKRDFDLTGNVTKLTYPDNTAIDYVIDGDSNRIDQVKDGANVVADYRYIGQNRVDRLDYLNGVIRTTTFDAVGRITEVNHDKSGTTVAKFTYTYDPNSNVLTERRAHNSNLYEVFTYDKRNELDTVWYDGTTSSAPTTYSKKVVHVWDGNFNLDQKTTTIAGTSATVNYTAGTRNEYTAVGGDSPIYSDKGELSDDDILSTYKYDWASHLVKITRGATNYTFVWDALGRRISTNSGTEVRFTSCNSAVVEEITSGSSPSLSAKWVHGASAQVLRMDRGGTLSYYHANREASTEKLTGTTGVPVESLEYEAFGKSSASSSARGNHFAWRGAFHDYTSGVDLAYDAYDPNVSYRWIAPIEGREYGIRGTLLGPGLPEAAASLSVNRFYLPIETKINNPTVSRVLWEASENPFAPRNDGARRDWGNEHIYVPGLRTSWRPNTPYLDPDLPGPLFPPGGPGGPTGPGAPSGPAGPDLPPTEGCRCHDGRMIPCRTGDCTACCLGVIAGSEWDPREQDAPETANDNEGSVNCGECDANRSCTNGCDCKSGCCILNCR